MSNDVGQHGFVSGKHSPEDLERFAALFVPAWEQAAEIAIDVDVGFAAAPVASSLAAALSATVPVDQDALPKAPGKPAIKGTMMGISAAVGPPPMLTDQPITLPAAPAALITSDPPPRLHNPPAPKAGLPPTVRVDRVVPPAPVDEELSVPRKRGPIAIFAIAGLVVVAGIGAFAITKALDSDKPKPAAAEAPVVQTKKTSVPDPSSVMGDEKASAKSDDKKSDDKPSAAKSDDKPAAKADETPAPKADDKPPAKADDKPAAKVDEPKVDTAPKVTPPVAPPKVDGPPKAPPPKVDAPPKGPPKGPPKIKDEF